MFLNPMLFAGVLSLATGAAAVPLSSDEAHHLAESYISKPFAPRRTTLEDYYAFEGAGSEYEERLTAACMQGKPLPASISRICTERSVAVDDVRAESMYWAWLKRWIPAPPHRILIRSVKRIDEGTPFEGDVVIADLNGTHLQFFRHDDKTGTGPSLGRFNLISINGKRIDSLIDGDLRVAKRRPAIGR